MLVSCGITPCPSAVAVHAVSNDSARLACPGKHTGSPRLQAVSLPRIRSGQSLFARDLAACRCSWYHIEAIRILTQSWEDPIYSPSLSQNHILI
jgi:hypothetical protein